MYDESIVHVEHAPSMFYMHYCAVVTAVMSKLTSQFQGKFCKLTEICKTEKLLSAVALSVNQEINKMGTLPHGIYEVAILQTGNQQNWEFTTWHLWICCFATTGNQQNWNFTM